MHPDDRKYTKEHEWIKIQENTATVGITDHAQSQLGDITFVELPQVGLDVKRSDSVATIESVKAASDVYAPVSGKVTEVNEVLADSPEIINSSPLEDGWIFKIELADRSELDGLMGPSEYESTL